MGEEAALTDDTPAQETDEEKEDIQTKMDDSSLMDEAAAPVLVPENPAIETHEVPDHEWRQSVKESTIYQAFTEEEENPAITTLFAPALTKAALRSLPIAPPVLSGGDLDNPNVMAILRNYKEKENTDETEDDDCQFTHRAEADPQNPNFGKKEAHPGEKSRRKSPEEIADFFFHSEEVAHEIVLSASAKTDLLSAIHEEFTAPWISPFEEANPMVIRLLEAEGKAG